jgi:hypothetical protein
VVGRTENDPRVRLSKRISKYFQKLSWYNLFFYLNYL